MYELKKKLERYLRVNLLGPGPRHMKKEFTVPRSHKCWETLPYGPVQDSTGITLPIAFTNSYAQHTVQVLGVATFITFISAHIYHSLSVLLNFHILTFRTFKASTRVIHVRLQLPYSSTARGSAYCSTGILIIRFVILVVFINKLYWSVWTCLTQLYLIVDYI